MLERSSFSHIPKEKQQELDIIIETILSVQKRDFTVEMILLFWSYARGDFILRDIVTEDGTTRVYESDFDILVVTKKPVQERNIRFQNTLMEKLKSNHSIKTHVGLIVEDIYHINTMLEEGRYFYIDIKNEGLMLYDNGKYQLKHARCLSPQEKHAMQKQDFALWFEKWENSLEKYSFALREGMLSEAAFELHQAAERFITTYLLVATAYKPKTHDLEVLYSKISQQNDIFAWWFFLEEPVEAESFDLLKKAYIESRYTRDYSVSEEELCFLEQKIRQLKIQVHKECEKEIGKIL